MRVMTEFRDQDLSGVRIEDVDLGGASVYGVRLEDAEMRKIEVVGGSARWVQIEGTRMRGVELVDVSISGELRNVVINGVDIGPLIDAELDRRMPERAKMRPEDVAGFREAWSILERLWDESVARARRLPEADLHIGVDGEWSFIQTLRHLNFAHGAWIERMVLGHLTPWHPLDLPWDEAPGWEGIPWDKDARPGLDEVLVERRRHQEAMRGVLASLTEEMLAGEISRDEPGWPRLKDFSFKQCLYIIVKEEWEHRLYAERDLALLEAGD